MLNTIRIFKTMIKGLFSYGKFEDKEDFWDWYWEQIPDKRYSGENLWDAWDTFKYDITLGHLRFYLRMLYGIHFKHYNGYSYTFKKNGCFVRDWRTSAWWFIPNDKSFSYGSICTITEYTNGNTFIR